jgi:hypothetical protein
MTITRMTVVVIAEAMITIVRSDRPRGWRSSLADADDAVVPSSKGVALSDAFDMMLKC